MIECEHKYLCLDTFGIIQYGVHNYHLGSLNHVSIAKIAKLIWALRFFERWILTSIIYSEFGVYEMSQNFETILTQLTQHISRQKKTN